MKVKWLTFWMFAIAVLLLPLQHVIASSAVKGEIEYTKNQLTPTLEQGAKKNPDPNDPNNPNNNGNGGGEKEDGKEEDDRPWWEKAADVVVDKVKKGTETVVDAVTDAGEYISDKTSEIVDATTEWWNERSLLEKSLIIVGVIATVVTLGAAAGVISAGAALTMGVMGAANYALYAATTDNVSFWGGLMWGGLGMVGGGIGLAAKGAKFLAPARAALSSGKAAVAGRLASFVPAAIKGSRFYPVIAGAARAIIPGMMKGAVAGSGLAVYTHMAKWAITGETPNWGEVGRDAMIWGASGAVAGGMFKPVANAASRFVSKGKAMIAGASTSAGSESVVSDWLEGKGIDLKKAAIAASAVVVLGGAGVLATQMTNKSVKQVATTTELASDTMKVAKADDGVQAGQNGSAEGKVNSSANTADKTSESTTTKTADQTGPLALDLQYFSSKTDSKSITDSVINTKTSQQLKTLLNEKGIDDVYFQSLLHPERTLNSSETALVNQVREELSTVASGTMMQKVIPEKDIYQYLYNKDYTGTRGFVTTKEHADGLISLEDIYKGERLDYSNTPFRITEEVVEYPFHIVKSDGFYGVFHYKADPSLLSTPNWNATPENYPFTGRGFTGSKTEIIPEYYQETKPFEDGDLLLVKNDKGEVFAELVFKKNKGWEINENK
ncbi:hypothetical protein QUF49_19715 [Fictibacillus sp. b24]|uniref:hypothetical protein n=1 Tax=Fictibacillus sp. b24 TaxID=3055863 RepID=UPI0025A26520|nr:hypothetical protein [Fictibacillus sp. b24]MDM5318229.1 hypothetical protein [Fictibacillus sp. b24]